MTSPSDSEKLHDDLVASQRPPSVNPFAQSANILVSVPETVEIRLVDASALVDYEVWTFLSSVLSSAVIGFGVAFFQATNSADRHNYLAIDIVFCALLVLCVSTAAFKRRKLAAKARRLRFRVGEPMPDEREAR